MVRGGEQLRRGTALVEKMNLVLEVLEFKLSLIHLAGTYDSKSVRSLRRKEEHLGVGKNT